MKHKGKSCYKEYGGKQVCSKVPKSEFEFRLKHFYNTRKSLMRAVAGLEILDAKVNKKKSKKTKIFNHFFTFLLTLSIKYF